MRIGGGVDEARSVSYATGRGCGEGEEVAVMESCPALEDGCVR
jgi:hypothetical protein